MASCLVRPALVTDRAEDGTLTVLARPLRMEDGRYVLGPPVEERVAGAAGPGAAEAPGDRIAVHWGWSCGVLAPRQADALAATLSDAVARANETV
jgi:hypothetical protein